jgi:putative AlgH/UPF0301 family transcriptional regulator
MRASRILGFGVASVILVLALIPAILGTTAQETPNSKTHGQFLVASRDLPDPLFHNSVVLMLPIKEGPLLVGLIVNKPTKVRLRDVFPNSPGLQKVDAMAYFGGPVDVDVVARSAVFRSKTPPKNATLVFGDVYVSFDPDAIAALAENSEQASTLRIFLGRAQWDPVQFENEVARGSWHNVPATADSIFSTFPETLWRTLIDRAEPRPVVQSDPPSRPLADTFASLIRHPATAW